MTEETISAARLWRYRIEYAALKVIETLSLVLPAVLARVMGRSIGALAWLIDRRHRKIAEENFQTAFPSASEAEVRRSIRKTYRHLGLVLIEVCRLKKYNSENIGNLIPRDGLEKLEHLLKLGKGVILLGGHIGNWEISGYGMAAHGLPMNAIGRPLDNPYLDRFLAARREAAGQKIISKFGGMRNVLRVLKNQELIGLLVDQNAGREGVFAPFFGRVAATWHTTALLAMKTGAPVISVSSYREAGDKTHRYLVGEPIDVVNTGDEEEDIKENTTRFNRALEAVIRKHPEQWLWMHRRWKTRPLDEVKDIPGTAPVKEEKKC